jgi:hypothetical protein
MPGPRYTRAHCAPLIRPSPFAGRPSESWLGAVCSAAVPLLHTSSLTDLERASTALVVLQHAPGRAWLMGATMRVDQLAHAAAREDCQEEEEGEQGASERGKRGAWREALLASTKALAVLGSSQARAWCARPAREGCRRGSNCCFGLLRSTQTARSTGQQLPNGANDCKPLTLVHRDVAPLLLYRYQCVQRTGYLPWDLEQLKYRSQVQQQRRVEQQRQQQQQQQGLRQVRWHGGCGWCEPLVALVVYLLPGTAMQMAWWAACALPCPCPWPIVHTCRMQAARAAPQPPPLSSLDELLAPALSSLDGASSGGSDLADEGKLEGDPAAAAARTGSAGGEADDLLSAVHAPPLTPVLEEPLEAVLEHKPLLQVCCSSLHGRAPLAAKSLSYHYTGNTPMPLALAHPCSNRACGLFATEAYSLEAGACSL